jgi:hypothetical protein
MRRAWVLAAAGVVLVATATILGLILFRKYGNFELALPELTIWSFVVGPMTVAFLGLLFVEMKRPSVVRRTRSFLFGLFGANAASPPASSMASLVSRMLPVTIPTAAGRYWDWYWARSGRPSVCWRQSASFWKPWEA